MSELSNVLTNLTQCLQFALRRLAPRAASCRAKQTSYLSSLAILLSWSFYSHYCQLSAIKYLNFNKSSGHMSNVAKDRSAPACPSVAAATGATHATAVKTGYKEHTRRSQDIDGDIILCLDSVPARPAHLGCGIFQTFCR